MEGTNTGRENAEGMASVGVRLTAQLGWGAKAPVVSHLIRIDFDRARRDKAGRAMRFGGRVAHSNAIALLYPFNKLLFVFYSFVVLLESSETDNVVPVLV